jgi:hypothetical protein
MHQNGRALVDRNSKPWKGKQGRPFSVILQSFYQDIVFTSHTTGASEIGIDVIMGVRGILNQTLFS